MPTALETMVKILKLERDQGGKDAAVVGGMSAFCKQWEKEARNQARRPTHHILIDEIVDTLLQYEQFTAESERIEKLSYLLDRITNRQPAPPEYKSRIKEWERTIRSRDAEPVARADTPARQREHSDRRQARPQRSRRSGQRPSKPVIGDENSSMDDDYVRAPQLDEPDLPSLPRLSRPPRIERERQSIDDALRVLQDLTAPVTAVRGIGQKQSALIAKLGVHSVGDMLYNFPRDYHDYTQFKCIAALVAGDELPVIGTVTSARTLIGKGNRKDFSLRLSDGSGSLTARFFGQSYLAQSIRPGDEIALSGKVSVYQSSLHMTNPEWEHLDSDNLHTIGIVPVYRMTEGLRPRQYRRRVKTLAEQWASKLPDPLPLPVLERAELADLGWSVQQMHFPEGWDHLDHARRRVAFDDVILLQLSLLAQRRNWQSNPGIPLTASDESLNEFCKDAFPFELTDSQERAIDEICSDMARAVPMKRLLQGDVGSGKTAVAAAAMAIARTNKRQAALMAPTGILAEQHYSNLSETFARLPTEKRPTLALLTSAVAPAERATTLRGLADGTIDFAIGTHALIQQDVDFHNLALAIVDEQHRFGVDQRGKLQGKGRNPHLLVMSATPIPRTLASTKYADLDVSVLDQMPPGRQPVVTKVIHPIARERLHGFVSAQIEAGGQAFFVHPLVDESDQVETASAIEAYEQLSKVFFRQEVCLLHGRMSPADKDKVMAEFGRGEYDVMVTTTVAEVGVDVPNASVIVVDGANRFGLAQLHQLRGRVGRGQRQSYCFLIPDESYQLDLDRLDMARGGDLPASELPAAERRLLALEQCNDGFELAELDWQLRGAGELLGRRQSGHDHLQFPELSTPELIELAQREARTIFEEDPEFALPEHQLLAQMVGARLAHAADVG